MFRKMRRFRQQLDREETVAILERGKTGILGVIGDEGYPYTVPVNYVYRDGKIYIHGAKAGHKYDAMKANDKVSFCVIDRDDVVAEELTTYFKSAVAFGRVRILDDENEIIEAARILGLKYYNVPEAVDSEIRRELNRLCCYEITIEHLTGKEAKELMMARNTEAKQ